VVPGRLSRDKADSVTRRGRPRFGLCAPLLDLTQDHQFELTPSHPRGQAPHHGRRVAEDVEISSSDGAFSSVRERYDHTVAEREPVEIAVVLSDSEAAEAVRAAAAADLESDAQVAEKRSLDGSVAEWVALATVAGPAIRVVLDTIFRFVELGRVKSFKYKDIVIDNPQKEDLELLRERVATESRDESAR
jgi:hypothetical protein